MPPYTTSFMLFSILSSFAQGLGTSDSSDWPEPIKINLTNYDEFHLYIVGTNFTYNTGTDGSIIVATRYFCWSDIFIPPDDMYNIIENEESYYDCNITTDTTCSVDPALISSNFNITGLTIFDCGIPGPTWQMYPNSDHIYDIYLHNYLTGIGKHLEHDAEDYKDPDIVNLHTHGLHVTPTVDNIVDVGLHPMCPEALKSTLSSEELINLKCSNSSFGAEHLYNYTIPDDHYPGSHWYHAHWHGATTLHVSGGIYGAIDVLPRNTYLDYQPNITDENDHNVMVSYVFLVPNSVCNYFLNTHKCNNETIKSKNGISPFNFPVQSTCIVNCVTKKQQPYEYGNSSTKYFVEFGGSLTSEPYVATFIVNGRYQPYLNIKTGEWHRLRIVNTNMVYLIWQLNALDAASGPPVDKDVCQVWYVSIFFFFFQFLFWICFIFDVFFGFGFVCLVFSFFLFWFCLPLPHQTGSSQRMVFSLKMVLDWYKNLHTMINL